MIKQFKYIGIGALVFLSSCTKDFQAINTDPTQYIPENFDANYFLSSSERNYQEVVVGYGGPLLFQSGWTQVFAMATVNGDYYANGDKYVQSSNTNSYAQSSWNNGYRSAALANEILINHGGDPAWSNITGIANIMKVLNLQYITDAYGDAPFTEAWKARDGNTLPVYDKQQDIYNSSLALLETSLAGMDPSKPKATADISSLAGDITKWKRFGYSLMLRMAMRLVKRDAALARTWAEKAAAGGTLTAADDVYFKTDNSNGYGNGNVGAWLNTTDFYQVRWSDNLIDFLKSNNDPRLSVIAEVPNDGMTANNDQAQAGNNDPSLQRGLPNGYDLISGSSRNITTSPGYPGGTGSGQNVTPIGKYSRPKISTYLNRDLPVFVMTYAETELLLAEAAAKGWEVGGTATQHYKNAVEGGLLAINAFAPNSISALQAAAFANAHPLNVSNLDASLEMINMQYWATTGVLLNFGETWNNWKRSGYPELTPVNYPGNFSGGKIPRRQPYPTGEATSNTANYESAAGQITGGDTFSARVWWDQ